MQITYATSCICIDILLYNDANDTGELHLFQRRTCLEEMSQATPKEFGFFCNFFFVSIILNGTNITQPVLF